MINAILLALALIGQVKTDDLNFINAQEQFVQASYPYHLPPWWSTKYNELCSKTYSIRREAYEDIVVHCWKEPKEARWLFWGYNSPDKDLALWCNKALWKLSECPVCKGFGIHEWEWAGNTTSNGLKTGECICGNWHANHPVINPCINCKGDKRFWTRAVKDD